MLQLLDWHIATRLGCQRAGETAALCSRQQVADSVAPRLVLALPMAGPFILGAHRMHHPHRLAVVNVVILRTQIAHAAQHLLGTLLGFVARQLALGLAGMKISHRRRCNVHRCTQDCLAILKQLRTQVRDLEGGQRQHADHRDGDRNQQPRLQAHRIEHV
ncbi:hypothetical protein SDC9_202979 [bioreactor metagenome]|uniref:Uncharacterized protein n=1 Tax=bioreactor metagenome TaxID=1076179 RepID=A0A645IVY8_9ZZZZ